MSTEIANTLHNIFAFVVKYSVILFSGIGESKLNI